MGVYQFSLENKKKSKRFVKKLTRYISRGRFGFSFYLYKREIFFGVEIAPVIIPAKHKKVRVSKAKTEFVPVRE